MLPHFLIVSVERGGTTSLYRYLTQHPRVAPSFRKEIDFFDFNWSRGLGWYRAHFPLRGRRAEARITGEATPYYFYHPQVPARIAASLPDVRLVALFRNPVERAFSHYQMNVRQGKEPLSFAEAIEREEERVRAEWSRLEQGEIEFSEAHYKFAYLMRGIYVDRLKAWHKHFAPERLLVVRSEDLYADPAGTTARVSEFLGLTPAPLRDAKAYNQKPYSPIDPALRGRLVDYFAPHNERLYEYLGRSFGWE